MVQAEGHSVGTAHQRHSKPTRDLVVVGTVVLYRPLPFLVAAFFSVYTIGLLCYNMAEN